MKRLNQVLFIMWIVLCCILDCYVILYIRIPQVIYLVIGLELLTLLVMGSMYKASKDEMAKMVGELSRLIEQMTTLEQQEVFSSVEEHMTSRLQVQVRRLSDILRAQGSRNLVAKQELEALVSDIAHQLKTPLTNVGLYTQLLETPDLDEASYSQFYEGLRSEVDKLQFLLDALIQMSRLEGGVIKIVEEEAVLQETCLTAIKAVYMKAKQKNIELIFDGGEDLIICHDAKWTAQAILNLLDNAIKYSGSHTKIRLSIRPYEFFVRIDIEDQGMGISEKEYAHIFKRFYRGKSSTKIEGIGIGLYLTRKIIETQKGYIKVKSQEGKGSTFTVMLPFRKKSS